MWASPSWWGSGREQWSRKTWKEDLIRTIEARIHAAPLDVAGSREALDAIASDEYLPVRLKGRFLHDKERHVFAVEEAKGGRDPKDQGGLGWYVFTPLETAEGVSVLVNRGFVPDALKQPATRAEGQLSGEVEVVGLVRHAPEKGTFEQPGDAARNTYFWRDLKGMAQDAGLEPKAVEINLYVDALAEPKPPGGWPRGGTTRLDIPNRHLEYVLTWYGLAFALLAVFAVFAKARLNAAHDA